MKKLLKYLKDYRKECVLAPLFKMLEATFELFVPLVMAKIIDVGIANTDQPYIIKMCLVLIALGIIGLVCSITAQYFSARAAVGFATKLRHALLSHIQKLSFAKLDTTGVSTLITRMTSDINQAQTGVNMVLRLFLRSPFIVVGAMVMAFTIDVKAALVFVVTIPLLSIVVFGIMLISIPLYKKVQGYLDHVTLITRENLTGVRDIRAFHKEKDETKRFQQANQELSDMQIFVGKISAMMNPMTYIIINAATIVLLYIGAIRVDHGIISQGEVVALVNYMSQILVELVKFANFIVTVTKAWACGNRIQAVFSIPEGMEESSEKPEQTEKTSPYRVEFSHVSMAYEGAGAESLTDIDFRVKKGETVGIIGATGSGKSSLVNLIPRFYDVTKGSVKVDGVDVREYETETLRQKVGMVLQKAILFSGTIEENVRWGKADATQEEVYAALECAQAMEVVEKKEGELSYEIEQEGRNLSGGQKQRISIARALVRHPDILILDDSASALDFATDAKLRKAISQLDPEMTVFIVSQRTSSLQQADQILVLDDGAIVGKGTHDELLKTCEVYREIYDSQFQKRREEAVV
ncbi:MAG: ABC transporter ATP-binding protein [Lachnospiraceae bacterium]